MNISIHIPKLVFWILGGALGVVVLLLAAFGVLFVRFLRDFRPFGG